MISSEETAGCDQKELGLHQQHGKLCGLIYTAVALANNELKMGAEIAWKWSSSTSIKHTINLAHGVLYFSIPSLRGTSKGVVDLRI